MLDVIFMVSVEMKMFVVANIVVELVCAVVCLCLFVCVYVCALCHM